ncbi:MAG: LPXTG cell wall anchor domain-containing protein, partial [Actinomycetota bacterium]|nr:LPXTG cell wall anchor domain-containing protein [Actinomycetota bacterium]
EGSAYFSQNNGGGLWALNPDDVDAAGGSATLRKVLSTTAITQANDGLGCPSESITEDQALPGSAGQATLVYHANGGNGDPDDLATSPDESVNLSELEPNRDGFSFTSWNSSEDGSGTSYGAGDAFVMPGDGETDHLHAQWIQNPVTTTTEVPVTTTTEIPATTTTEVPSPQTLPATGSGSPSVPLIIMLIVVGGALLLVRRPSSDST